MKAITRERFNLYCCAPITVTSAVFLQHAHGCPGGIHLPPAGAEVMHVYHTDSIHRDEAQGEPFLTNVLQLTSEQQFSRAGEAYFSPDSNWIIFQAVPVEEETGGDPVYAMYVAALIYDETRTPTGIEDPIRLSAEGSANTCGWFHPTLPGVVLYGSTITPPTSSDTATYQRDNSRYSWEFPREMEIVTQTIPAIVNRSVTNESLKSELLARADLNNPTPIFTRDGYDAEGSWSPDGRHILYTQVEPGESDGDLYIYNIALDTHTPLITFPGYDGGPFFSPDGTRITYRSDRYLDDHLQLYVSDLAFDAEGNVTGIAKETQLTNDGHVNWAPYFHYPSGDYILYATSNISHQNYEVFALATNRHANGDMPTPLRVTNAPGFDGLPVFNRDSSLLMWTGQRTPPSASGARSSQLCIAQTTAKVPDGLVLPEGSSGGASSGAASSAPLADALASVSDDTRLFNDHITTLASDWFEGRFPGTRGIELAEEYIAHTFQSLDLAPAFGRGANASYFQPFEFTLRSPGGASAGEELTARNVGAILKGRGELASQFIVIGAHHDHLGYGEHGSISGKGEIHDGADDNASGTAGVLLAAEVLTRAYRDLPPAADARSIIFTTFSAEELGLNGSRFFVDNPPRSMDRIDLMMNFDMIGRITNETVSLTGASSAPELQSIITPLASESLLTVSQEDGLTSRSDHAAFYDKQVPVLFFTITPFHDDYHTPEDESWKINRVGATHAAILAADIAYEFARSWDELTFTEVEGYDQGGPSVSLGDMKVRFGIMPGNYNDSKPGVAVERVSRNTSASLGGVLAGDRMMEWNGVLIESVGAWMKMLGTHKPGDVVIVTVERNGEEVDLSIELLAGE